jgi:hypothetical protein
MYATLAAWTMGRINTCVLRIWCPFLMDELSTKDGEILKKRIIP